MAKPLPPYMLPVHRVASQPDGTYIITIDPPAWTRATTKQLTLTSDQYTGFIAWKAGRALIQNALPDLSLDQRELLITGLDSEDFVEITRTERNA